MVKSNNKKYCSYNSKRESIANHLVVFKNREVDFFTNFSSILDFNVL